MGFLFLLQGIIHVWMVSSISGLQSRYEVFLEDVTIDYVDRKLVDVITEVYKINATTNAAKGSMIVKFDVPDDLKGRAESFKLVKNEYRSTFFHIEKSVKEALEMQSFGVQKFLHEYTRPILVWPIRKNVRYGLVDFVPDISNFRAHMPLGRWKSQATILFCSNSV